MVGAAISIALLMEGTMSADEPDDLPKVILVHPPSDEWYLELAGDDPTRRAAVKRWLASEGDVELIANVNESRFEILRFEDAIVSIEDTKLLKYFPEIDRVEFVRSLVSVEAWDEIAKLNHLLSMHVEECPEVDDRVCRVVALLQRLEGLSLVSTRIDDQGAASLADMLKLKYLSVIHANVTSHGLQQLAKLPRLESLDLSGTSIDDDGLRYLANKSNIKWLLFSDTKVTDEGIRHLGALVQMVSLVMENTDITNRSLEVISGFTDLYRLNVRGTAITGEGLVHLRKLQKLHDLNLRDTAIDDAAVPTLVEMPWLNPLDLRGTKISKAGVEQIRAALSPSAALYNDHDVPIVDRARLEAERENKRRLHD